MCSALKQLFLLVGLAVVSAAIALAQAPRKAASAGFDLVVTNATIVTMDPARHVIEDGVIGVSGDSISFVGPASDFYARNGKAFAAIQTIDARGKLIMPGLINAHTHIPMVLMRGLVDDVTLDDWLRKYIFPAEAKNVNEEFVRWGSRLALAEMIRGGTTAFADMYYFEDAVAEETKAAGLRGFLGETWIDFPAPDNKNEAEMAAYTEKFLKKWQGDALIHASVAPHSIYTCSEKNAEGFSGAGKEIPRAHPDPRCGNAEGTGGQHREECRDAGAIPGANRIPGARCAGGPLHLGGLHGHEDSGGPPGGLRAQPVEQHDAGERSCAGGG